MSYNIITISVILCCIIQSSKNLRKKNNSEHIILLSHIPHYITLHSTFIGDFLPSEIRIWLEFL